MSDPSDMEQAEGSPETVDKALSEDSEEKQFGLPADQMPEEIQDNDD